MKCNIEKFYSNVSKHPTISYMRFLEPAAVRINSAFAVVCRCSMKPASRWCPFAVASRWSRGINETLRDLWDSLINMSALWINLAQEMWRGYLYLESSRVRVGQVAPDTYSTINVRSQLLDN
jgi:hypothetical protein